MKRFILIAAAAIACAAASAQTPKFAHVNFNELIQLMPEMDSARVQSDAAQKEASWTPAVRQSKQNELSEIQTRIQEFEQAIQQDLQQLQSQLMAPIYQKAQEQVNAIAKAGGYIFVFDSSQVLYIDASQSNDLTSEARKALGIPDDRTLESLQAELQARAQAQQQ